MTSRKQQPRDGSFEQAVESLTRQRRIVVIAFWPFMAMNYLIGPILVSSHWKLWFVGALGVAVIGFGGYLIWLTEKARRLVEQTGFKKCTKCGYDMEGVDLDRCPECATPFNVAEAEEHWRDHLLR